MFIFKKKKKVTHQNKVFTALIEQIDGEKILVKEISFSEEVFLKYLKNTYSPKRVITLFSEK